MTTKYAVLTIRDNRAVFLGAEKAPDLFQEVYGENALCYTDKPALAGLWSAESATSRAIEATAIRAVELVEVGTARAALLGACHWLQAIEDEQEFRTNGLCR